MTDINNKKNDNEKIITPDDKATTQSGGNKDKGNELADNVSKAVQGDTKAAKDIYKQAKETTGKAADEIYDTAAKKASSKIDEQKSNLAAGLADVANNIRQIGESFGDEKQPNGIAKLTTNYGNTLADKVEGFSSYLDDRNLSEMMRDVEDFAHRNPALFLGGAFALGVVAARFLKSSSSNQALMRRQRYERKGEYLPDEHEGVHLPKDLDKQVKAQENKSASAASSNKGA
ncbi:hypothetical protein BH20ACI1_BH20ACI1_13410 [soil metagenome]